MIWWAEFNLASSASFSGSHSSALTVQLLLCVCVIHIGDCVFLWINVSALLPSGN